MVTRRDIILPIAIRGMLAREWLRSRIVYNPLSSSFHQNPYPKYARLRARDPLHWSYLVNGWVMTRHEDCDEILRDHRRWSNEERTNQPPPEDALAAEAPSMLFVDPPDHTRLRGLVSKAFTPRAIEQLKPRIDGIVDEIIQGLPEGEPVDLMKVLAFPLPVVVIAEMLGVPPEDRDDFKRWSDPVARTLEPTIKPHEQKEAQAAFEELTQYFEQIVAERSKSPREDLVSALIAAEEAGDRLTHGELLSTLRLLLVAGNETTTNLIGNGMLALLRNPDQLDRLRYNLDGLMESAVEELLRYDSPVQTDGRTALEDMVLHGKQVKKGQRVLTLLGAANRDPRVFANPNKLDLGRTENRHLAFARGIHHCLGAPLARAEGQATFKALLHTFPRIELAEEPQFKDHVVLRGLKSLQVRLYRS